MCLSSSQFFELIKSGELGEVEAVLAENPALAGAVDPESKASAIQLAAYYGRRAVLDRLIAEDPEMDFATACVAGRMDVVRRRLSEKDQMSADGFTPLCLASAFAQNEAVRELLEAGADPNLRSEALGGVAPIHSAVFGRNLGAVRLLVEGGADVDARQSGGFTALHGAAQNGDLYMVEYLISKGADPELKTDDGRSAHELTENPLIQALL